MPQDCWACNVDLGFKLCSGPAFAEGANAAGV